MWRRPNEIETPETKFHKGDRVRLTGGLYLVNGDYQEAKGAIAEVLNVNPFSGETSYLCRLEDGTGFFSEDDLEEATTRDWVDIVCRLGDRQELTRTQLLSEWEQAVEDKADIETLKRFKAIADRESPPPQDLVGQLVGVNSVEGATIAYVKAVAWNYYADFSVELGEVVEEPNSHIVSTPRASVFPVCPIYPQKSATKYFMPSNGSQGEVFMDSWCYRCKHDAFDRGGDSCEILSLALINEQPQQWRYIDGQPTCTSFEEWNPCNNSPTATYSEELAGSASPLSNQELPLQPHTATSMRMRSPSTNPTSPSFQSTEISEVSHHRKETSISSQLASLAREPVAPEPEQDSTIQTQPSGGKDCESSAKLNPDTQSSNNLWELSDEDLEQSLEDSRWADIQESMQSLAQQDWALATVANDCSLLPTPTANESRESGRPAGHSKLEKKCRELGLTPAGSQLSPEAMAMLMGFPSSWLKAIAQTSPQPPQPGMREELPPESSPENPAPQPRLSGASSGLEVTYSKRRSLMKVSGWIEFQSKVATGKKGKKTYEYYYYRWEEWEGDRLLRTPSKRVKAERVRLLKSLIERVDMDVRDILVRSEDWAY